MKIAKSKYKNRFHDEGLKSFLQLAQSQIYQRIGKQITRIDEQAFHEQTGKLFMNRPARIS
jgi:hypothetical protein